MLKACEILPEHSFESIEVEARQPHHLGIFQPGEKSSKSIPAFTAEALRVLIILCYKNVSAHRARNEQSGQVWSEEDVGSEVNAAK